MLKNIDHKKLEIKEAVNQAYNISINENRNNDNEEVIKLLLQKVKINLFDMEVLMKEACTKGYVNVVKWLVEKIVHSKFDIDTAINVLIYPWYSECNKEIFKMLIENINQNLYDIGLVIEEASRKDRSKRVFWLLKTKDNSLFDMKYVMNEACRNSDLQIVKYVLENIDNNCFDVRSAINTACCNSNKNSLEVVKWLLKYSTLNMLDLESAMNNACRYGNIAVVKWLWG